MLKTRVITAVLLLAALLPSLFFFPQGYWALLTAVICGIAAWEWGGLIGLGARNKLACGAALVVVCVLATLLFPSFVTDPLGGEGNGPVLTVLYGLATFFWAVVVPLWLRRKWQPGPFLGLLVGIVVILPAWLALVHLRTLGPGALLGILAVVWMSDVAAYFAGKAFGKHKLAPSISPGKTWEGALGACVGVLIYGVVVRQAFQVDGVSLGLWLVGLLLVTAVGIVGDLFESLLKRQTGIKDSSHILPGHGGVLDRIDSLTSTLPTVALLWLLFVVKTQ